MSYRNNRDPGVLRPSEITTAPLMRVGATCSSGLEPAPRHSTGGSGRPRSAGRHPGPGKLAPLPAVQSAVPGADTFEKLTSYADITSYNNFYEFGTDKGDPEQNARTLKTRPWMV